MNASKKLAAVDFIPHEKPMVFVDDLVEVGENFAEATLTIQPALMFCEAAGLPTWSSIELMAQTVSLYAGAQSQKVGQRPKIGFLLGTRKLHLPVAYFAMGEVVTIRAERQYLHEGLGQFACEIQYQEHTINAMLSVYEPE
ncbi:MULTISPECIES: 3-hydroxylacyl-ACP dehydratase [Acinetobacter]|uniref:3-hydroxylacyl-ACP dehydratase n=1 Tax=Acinetobacter piscicola TaxID=2006115 RepID=A0A4Q4GWA6_9GAMM|nr:MULTISPECIES: 3-hydroxylacyl-ACP dehydratase [Acinetobacter]MDM1757775.1 3-hydroxylacyl-ACP dehydratase [Acinetobacter sp. 256-1]MDM1761871.1 3-hydroxylacyl-ACP dehydratase [Acinetobacter sp. 251-1]QOW45017.1 3-hydroxylacyl-ACP dehydratase [Acinetobacter piscicola]RYL25891.1 3-hydroxylacyl-ACP dehydratase [Acinetobacter piscicola]